MRVLMCPPTEYSIKWEINPWMSLDSQPDKNRAWAQWHRVFEIYQKLRMRVLLIQPVKDLSDMVFTANAAWGRKENFILSNFKHKERQPEIMHYRNWMEAHGFTTFSDLPKNVIFEGQGDFITLKEAYLFGHGVRSSLEAHEIVKKRFKLHKEIISLRLVDPRFYHLDTCLMYISPIDSVMYYPGAFDAESQKKIGALDADKMEVSEEEAVSFICNGVYSEDTVVLGTKSPRIISRLKRKGLDTISVDVSEFKKSGAGLRCLTLFLD